MPDSTSNPKRKRRWFQFSLRTFLLLVTVFAVWFGWLTHKAREQRKAVAWVREMGGQVLYDYQIEETHEEVFYRDSTGSYTRIRNPAPAYGQLKRGVVEPLGPKWVRDKLGIDFMDDVVKVHFQNTQASDLTPLAGLKNLKWLILDTGYGGHATQEWHRGRTRITDLTPLAGLKNLQRLNVSDTHVSDLTPIAGLNLQELDLRSTYVRDLTLLAGLKNLKYLYLNRTQVSDVTPLSGLKNLKYLSLFNTPVSDATPLARLKNLKGLVLYRTQVSEEQFAALRKALPDCEIVWSPR